MAEKKQTTTTGAQGGRARGGRKTGSDTEGGAARGDGSAKQPPKTARGASSGRRATKSKKADLQKDLRDFASARPSGWSHEDWLNFLESLKERGHNINDRDAVGMALERERLDLALERVKGVGPQRRKALVERYGTLWNLRSADPEDISSAAGIKRDLAERVKAELG